MITATDHHLQGPDPVTQVSRGECRPSRFRLVTCHLPCTLQVCFMSSSLDLGVSSTSAAVFSMSLPTPFSNANMHPYRKLTMPTKYINPSSTLPLPHQQAPSHHVHSNLPSPAQDPDPLPPSRPTPSPHAAQPSLCNPSGALQVPPPSDGVVPALRTPAPSARRDAHSKRNVHDLTRCAISPFS